MIETPQGSSTAAARVASARSRGGGRQLPQRALWGRYTASWGSPSYQTWDIQPRFRPSDDASLARRHRCELPMADQFAGGQHRRVKGKRYGGATKETERPCTRALGLVSRQCTLRNWFLQGGTAHGAVCRLCGVSAFFSKADRPESLEHLSRRRRSPPFLATCSRCSDGQGVLKFFLRGIACGATPSEAARHRPRSRKLFAPFLKILQIGADESSSL